MRNFIEKQLGMSVEGLINVIISEKCGYIDGVGSAPTLLDISGIYCRYLYRLLYVKSLISFLFTSF